MTAVRFRRASTNFKQSVSSHYNEARHGNWDCEILRDVAVHVVNDPLGILDVPVSARGEAKQNSRPPNLHHNT